VKEGSSISLSLQAVQDKQVVELEALQAAKQQPASTEISPLIVTLQRKSWPVTRRPVHTGAISGKLHSDHAKITVMRSRALTKGVHIVYCMYLL
jgi:hypothetical protein